MNEFEKRYASLNANQKKAVDAIDGPVMVVAGPGTGKTELLSVRVANILQKTDALPQNILCLTFTDSGAVAMRERLAGLLGPQAYKVAIHTFHSFGSEVINQNGDYFYQGAHFRPADELSSYEVLSEILETLPYGNPIASTMNSKFTHLKDIQTAISELKRGGLTSDELDKVLEKNDAFTSWIQPQIQTVFGKTVSKKMLPEVAQLIDEISSYEAEPFTLIGYAPLHELICESLRLAYDEALANNTTKPLTAWKKAYLEKNAHDEQTLKDEKRSAKLRALSTVYYKYLVSMQEHELFDYDDMILRVVHALEVFDELRYNLQETYQYILIDEFQDTNDAQMRLVWNLTNNPASEGRPNLMVVGDDDQAIYRFQGALVSNILDFTKRYRDVKVVTLTDNYRSQPEVLTLARSVIIQGDERLENTLEGIDKTLTPHRTTTEPLVASVRYETTSQAHHGLATTIADEFKKNPSKTRAVIARNHRQLIALLPHLQAQSLPLRYERQEDVLESEPVQQLELAARVVYAVAEQEPELADELLSELLAHPAWGISPVELWKLSLEAHRAKKQWLETMLEKEGLLHSIAEWIVVASALSKTEPLEYVLDYLFGTVTQQSADTEQVDDNEVSDEQSDEFSSPLRAHFFGPRDVSARYLDHLSALQKIRASLREYRPDQTLKLADFIEFVDLHHELDLPIQGRGEVETGISAITLLSAHKAKGLEFDCVYIVDAQESTWGEGARHRGRLISFPSNLPLSPAGDSSDERLRLLYVALTRAKDQLQLVSARTNESGKDLLPIGAVAENVVAITDHAPLTLADTIAATQHDWRAPLYTVAETDKTQLLKPLLERYKLSATHLNNFLDVSRGGPEHFLLHNLLRFPQAMGPSAAYGSAMHASLQRAHQHFSATSNKRPVEDVLHDFEKILREFQLSASDYTQYLARGSEALNLFLAQRYASFAESQLVERTFSGDNVTVGDALVSGAIDLIDIDHDEKTIFVTDYKTGKAVQEWKGKTEYEKIKLHHYEQQLMLYKLLVERSRQFAGYTVTGARIEFVEPDPRGQIVLLDYTYDREKLAEFERLVSAVWTRILSLDFTLSSDYEPTLKGIVEFEADISKNLESRKPSLEEGTAFPAE